MLWLLVSVIPPLLWAVVNHFDKYLLSKASHHSSVNVLMVYSTGFSLVVLPIAYFFARSELIVDPTQVLIQLVGGILLTISIYFYLVALNKDEASVVIPFALLVPIFGYLFGYLLLGETLAPREILACLLILFGALILSLEFDEERHFRLRHGVLWSMAIVTATQAAQETLFKFVTINNSFAVSIFWLHAGVAICGLFLILTHQNLLAEFSHSVRVNGRTMFGLNFASEALSAIAYIVRDYATLLAPIALVMTLNGYQPAFVFILGVILTILMPKFVNEKIKTTHLLHKGLAILIMIIGTTMIAVAQ